MTYNALLTPPDESSWGDVKAFLDRIEAEGLPPGARAVTTWLETLLDPRGRQDALERANHNLSEAIDRAQEVLALLDAAQAALWEGTT